MANHDQTPTHELITPTLKGIEHLLDPQENMLLIRSLIGTVKDRLLSGIPVDPESASDMSVTLGLVIDRLPECKRIKKQN